MALRDHAVRRRLDHEIGAVEVDLHRPLERLDRHVEKGVERADAGIVDEDVDLAERGHRAVDKGARRLRIGDVAVQREGAAPQRLDLGDAARRAFIVVQIVDRDIGAVPRGADRSGTADPRRPAGDKHCLALKQHETLLSIYRRDRGGGGGWRLRTSRDPGSPPSPWRGRHPTAPAYDRPPYIARRSTR